MAFLHHRASLLRNMYGLVVNPESISWSLTFGGGNPWIQASKLTLTTRIPTTRISWLEVHFMQHLQVLVGMGGAVRAGSCVWFPGTFLSQSFLPGDASLGQSLGSTLGMLKETEWKSFGSPAHPRREFCVHMRCFFEALSPHLATADNGELRNLCCMFPFWCAPSPPPLCCCIWKVTGCLNCSFSSFRLAVAVLYDTLSDQWASQGSLDSRSGCDVVQYWCVLLWGLKSIILHVELGSSLETPATDLLGFKLFLGQLFCLQLNLRVAEDVTKFYPLLLTPVTDPASELKLQLITWSNLGWNSSALMPASKWGAPSLRGSVDHGEGSTSEVVHLC